MTTDDQTPMAASGAEAPAADSGPPLRLVRGDATPEEVAAVLAVLAAATGDADTEPAPRHTSRWASRERLVRRPATPGPGAWRASAWPT
jgi:hypothetical protein